MKCIKDYILDFPLTPRGTACCQVSIYRAVAEWGETGNIIILVTERNYPCITLYPIIATLVQRKEQFDWPDELEWYCDGATQDRVEGPTLWRMNLRPVPEGWLWKNLRWESGGYNGPLTDVERARFFSGLGSADPLMLMKAAAPWLSSAG